MHNNIFKNKKATNQSLYKYKQAYFSEISSTGVVISKKKINTYSLVLKERHVSLVPHMILIRLNKLPIKGAMTFFWIKPFYKYIVMPLFWTFLCTKNNQSVYLVDMSLFRTNTLNKCRVMPLITLNTQPKCATITLSTYMPLFRPY